MTNEEALEELAELVDKLSNLNAAMSMTAVPAYIHMAGMREEIPKTIERLKAAYLELGGTDVWA